MVKFAHLPQADRVESLDFPPCIGREAYSRD